MGISDKEWDQRILCGDGNCIGIIGSDGRCRECGRPYDGEMPVPEEDAPIDDDGASVAATEPDTADAPEPEVELSATDSDAAADGWEDRTLCIDGSCIGVIGPDGRCKVCGKAHPGKQP